MRILVVEDNPKLNALLSGALGEAGFEIDQAHTASEALDALAVNVHDLAVLDLGLPDRDGLDVLKEVRTRKNMIPVLILTAREKLDDKLNGLNLGADDYLVKPFAFSELLARVEVLMRRTHNLSTNPASQTQLIVGDLRLDLLSRKVYRASQEIELQAREFRLLEYMMRHKNQVITRTMLLEHVWDYNFDPQTNVIDVHISRLRSKIDNNFETPIIRTVRGAGYTIEEPR